jgi:hypothetical protein
LPPLRSKLIGASLGICADKAAKKQQSTAMESSFSRRKNWNLRRSADGIPEGIPIKNLTKNFL